jgi:hypothetical protein
MLSFKHNGKKIFRSNHKKKMFWYVYLFKTSLIIRNNYFYLSGTMTMTRMRNILGFGHNLKQISNGCLTHNFLHTR